MQNEPRAVAYPIVSVDNALRLINILRSRAVLPAPHPAAAEFTGQGIGVSEAARQLRVAPSTVHRLLTMLVYRGFAVQDAAKRYHLGPSFAPPEATPDGPDLRAVVLPVLPRISRDLNETVHLVVLQGPSVHFLAGVEGDHPERIDNKEGMVLPAHTTAAGRALLAQLPPAELTALYPHGLPALFAATATDLPDLRRQLVSVVRRGYAISRDESERGIAGIAVPLRDTKGHTRGAIAAALHSSRCQGSRAHQISQVLLAEARQLAADLDAMP